MGKICRYQHLRPLLACPAEKNWNSFLNGGLFHLNTFRSFLLEMGQDLNEVVVSGIEPPSSREPPDAA
jgi:hypothetical protein